MPARLLQLTDCHLQQNPQHRLLDTDTAATLARVVDHACEQGSFDAVLATGDIAHDATPDTYRRFLDILRRKTIAPLVATPGNHDLGGPFDEVFGQVSTSGLDIGRWRIVAVDTHVDDQVGGVVTASAIAALEAGFDGHDGHRLVVGHHPVADTGTPWLDKDRIQNANQFLDALTNMSVRAYVFGHLHQRVDEEIDDVRLMGTPSTCFQFAPGTERFTVDDLPPGYRTIALFEDGRIESEVVRVR